MGLGMLLNPAGNAGISSYRIAVTPPELIGRVQSTSQFASMSVLPLSPVIAGLLLSELGGSAAILVLGGLTSGCGRDPGSGASRSVPRPALWHAAEESASPLRVESGVPICTP